ncbi:hypothetical protein JKP88DRAFT_317645 [Tribonema minus]|uniref:RanBP2-type domain-containing protein n=1 Tax=Tribonema minus TaxID=303371 RepID=A0A835Z6N2_9STRA|nr:hypothetical protein JKP88DRAFT_317645 [Tribonema minus]
MLRWFAASDGIRRRNAPRVPEEGSTTPAQQQLQPVPPPPPQPAPPAAAAADAATMPSAPQSRSDARRTAPQQHECATCTYVNEPGSSHCDMCGSVLGEGSLAAPAAPAAAAAAAAAADPGAAAGGNTDQQQQQQQRHHGDGGSTSSSAQPWPCPRCTFHNAPAAAACAMCGLPSSSAQGPGSSAQLPGSSAQLPGSSAQGPDGDDGDSVRPPDRTERTRLVQDDRVAEVMAARPSTGALAAAAAVAGGLMGGVGGGRMGALCGALMGGVIMDAEEQQLIC